uniref:GIY-YIG domain-containing protein n=1 Tax=Steinernema glaseri TaxID=37863 RepID=A0A1I7YZR9_9BILA
MDSVPHVFIESVALSLLDRWSLKESRNVPSRWGEISTATSQKIHALYVLVDAETDKLYAAARPVQAKQPHGRFSSHTENAVSLDSVDLKFVTNFRIRLEQWIFENLPSSWKEISPRKLQKLCHFIRPTTERRAPFRFDIESSNFLQLPYTNEVLLRKLLTMRLPVDYVSLGVNGTWSWSLEAAVKEFFSNCGPLYYVDCHFQHMEPSTVNTLIDKFVPVHESRFYLEQLLSKAQLERLVLKCELPGMMANLQVSVENASVTSCVTDFFDFDKYYSLKNVQKHRLVAFREEANVEARVTFCGLRSLDWRWTEVSRHWKQ